MKEALFYKKEKGLVKCELCHKCCVIAENKKGACGVRKNLKGVLYTLTYGRPCSIAIDPIEKKPLFHFLPGEKALSIGTFGCNFFCKGCQNYDISRGNPENTHLGFVNPEKIIDIAKKENCKVIAFTYNEPTMFFEYMLDIARLAKKSQIKTVLVSNGYIRKEALNQLAEFLDSANIDLKGFSENFYKSYCNASLNPVMENLVFLKEKVWLEITNLVIPGMNDSSFEVEEMCKWIKKNIGDVPIHFSRFFPLYKAEGMQATPLKTLENIKKIAEKHLSFVYVGNVSINGCEDTFCPACKKAVIQREGYMIRRIFLKNGLCSFCRTKIPGFWGLI